MSSHIEKPLSARKTSQEYKDNWDAIFGGNKNAHIGSSFDDFLKEEGIHEEVTTEATKRVKKAASKVLRDPKNSKKAKVARGEDLTQKSKPQWGDPTIRME